MRSKWISYKGVKIFFRHYDNMDASSLRLEVAACEDIICKEPERSVLILTDVRGTLNTHETTDIYKKSATNTRCYVKKSAVVGIGLSGPSKLLFDLIMKFSGQNAIPFKDLQKAKDWLVLD